MAASSAFVVTNSLRLRRTFAPRSPEVAFTSITPRLGGSAP
jgi:hypothetical protein